MLTPNDVRDSRFTVRHVRGGYDTDEVDRFLDQCHDTILRMAVTIQTLQQERS